MTTRILTGDARTMLATLPDQSVQTCVTSPPYWNLRDYGHADQIGREPTVQEYVANLVTVFREVWRVLKDDGVLWVNLGDSYARTGGTDRKASASASVGNTRKTLDLMPDRTQVAPAGIREKSLIGVPWRVAFALQDDGWILRSDVIWSKSNPMPESVTDRPTKSHEYVFMLVKSPQYYYDAAAIAEPTIYPVGGSHADAPQCSFNDKGAIPGSGQRSFRAIRDTRNKRSVWTIPTQAFSGAHYAVFPPKLVEPCILAGSRGGDTVLDPFGGSGTTGMVADRLGRHAVLIDLNPANSAMAKDRIYNDAPLFAALEVPS